MDMLNKEPHATKPHIWHYGLVAREWGEFLTKPGKEADFIKQVIQVIGEPALDLGCGSGRLLLPFLQSELDVDGCDYSQDMLAVCREHLEKEGLTTRIYNQAMHELDLPRRYRVIYACGVIGLGGDKQLTRQAMQRCCEHLRPGGVFVFDYQSPWNDPGYWEGNLPQNRQSLPLDWFEPQAERKYLSDGTQLENTVRIVSQDPLEGVAVRDIRHRLWRDGALAREEIHTMKMESYSKNELVLMLQLAGFGDVTIYGDYSHEPATADHKDLVFVAKKKGIDE